MLPLLGQLVRVERPVGLEQLVIQENKVVLLLLGRLEPLVGLVRLAGLVPLAKLAQLV